MSLESPAVLGQLTAWLTCRELMALRSVNRSCHAAIPRQTWELTVARLTSAQVMARLAQAFPNVWKLRLQDAILDEMPTMQSLVPWLDKHWKLRELELTRLTCVRGFYVHLETAKLKTLAIRQCYQVQDPAIVAQNLETLVVEHCPFTKFDGDTSLPGLKQLSVSSRSFRAKEARHLIKDMLARSPVLETLSIANCSQLEQVLIDPGDLPTLRQLNLSGCPKLERVHISSKTLQRLDLARNDQLQFVLLDLEHVVDLDLSFLKSLTHLFIRSPTLRRLNLRGCDQLARSTTCVLCPNLQFVVLQGTTLAVDDFNRDEVNQQVFALPPP